MKILLLVTLLGFTTGQIGLTLSLRSSNGALFPDECQEIININGTDSKYPESSMARILSMFCPIVTEFVDCLENNLDFLKRSNSPVYRLLADNFNSTVIRDRIFDICSRISTWPNDLECIWHVGDIIQHCDAKNTELMLRQELTVDDLCREMENISDCYKVAEDTHRCPRHVIEIHRTYIYLFIPSDCQIPSTPTTPPTVESGGQSSVLLDCFHETYPDVMKKIYQGLLAGQSNIFRYIFDAVNDICRSRAKFAACIEERFKPPFMQVDAIIDQILTNNAIGIALDEYCVLEISELEEKCLRESTGGMMVCNGMTYKIYGSTRTTTTGNSSFIPLHVFNTIPIPLKTDNADPDYVKYICPAINIVNQCMGIQLGRCSATLGQTFTNLNKQVFTSECRASKPTKEIIRSSATSILNMCGIPLWGQIQMLFLSNQSTNRNDNVFDIIRETIPAGCRFVEFYTTCISKRLSNSQNVFDKIVTKWLDLTDASRLQKIFRAVCDESKEIQKNFNCLAGAFANFAGSCVIKPEYQDMFEQFQNIYELDLKTITDACKPLKEIGFCAGNLTSNCNQELGKLAQNIVLEILRTDCGGTRPLTSNSERNIHNFLIVVYILLTVLLIL